MLDQRLTQWVKGEGFESGGSSERVTLLSENERSLHDWWRRTQLWTMETRESAFCDWTHLRGNPRAVIFLSTTQRSSFRDPGTTKHQVLYLYCTIPSIRHTDIPGTLYVCCPVHVWYVECVDTYAELGVYMIPGTRSPVDNAYASRGVCIFSRRTSMHTLVFSRRMHMRYEIWGVCISCVWPCGVQVLLHTPSTRIRLCMYNPKSWKSYVIWTTPRSQLWQLITTHNVIYIIIMTL